MMTFEKVLEVFNDYLNKDSVLEVVNTKRGYTVMIWDEKDEQCKNGRADHLRSVC